MRSIFGIFGDYRHAQDAVLNLQRQGFEDRDINVLVPEHSAKNNLPKGIHQATVD